MNKTNYKSTRLLVEAINKAMEAVRKAAMGNIPLPWDHLNELRDLVASLAEKASRTAVDDLPDLEPAEYVAAMKPLVSTYHHQLAKAGMLTGCLCEDLRANACILVLVGDEKSTVQVSHDPGRPDSKLIVDTIVSGIEGVFNQVAALEAAIDQAGAFGVTADPDRVRLLEEAEQVGWDSPAGEELRRRANLVTEEDRTP